MTEVLTTYADVNEVLRSRDFSESIRDSEESTSFIQGTLIGLNGREHVARRRILNNLFSEAEMRQKEELINKTLESTLDELGVGRDAVACDMQQICERLMWRLAASIIGLDMVDSGPAAEALRKNVVGIVHGIAIDNYAFPDREATLADARRAKETFQREYLQPALERRRAAKDAGTDQTGDIDMLTLMLQAWEPDWTDEMLVREASLFLIAATENNCSTLETCVVQLEAWWDAHPEERQYATDRDYLRNALYEALRLHIGGTLVRHRRAFVDTKLSSGRTFEAGEMASISLSQANRDPSVFGADADQFNPHRPKEFTDPRQTPYGVVFGGGAHLCLGKNLVLGKPEVPDGRTGLLVRTLHALFSAGLRIDKNNPPTLSDQHLDRYTSFPVHFDAR